jgi:cell division septum initiation protein DivIVA
MTSNISFNEEKSGYSKSQVDLYISKLAAEYTSLRTEYFSSEEKIKDLEAALAEANEAKASLESDRRRLEGKLNEAERKAGGNAEAAMAQEVARVLVDAETLAKQIKERAMTEATKVVEEAKAEYTSITAAKSKLLADIQNIDSRLRESIPEAFSVLPKVGAEPKSLFEIGF